MSYTYFISGHTDLTEAEFNEHYMMQLRYIVSESNFKFVVGDAKGADALAQILLAKELKDRSRVTVYHMFNSPRNNVGNFQTRGGFKTNKERDTAMTHVSTDDMLWVRPEAKQKELLGDKYNPNFVSGTMKNKLRREALLYANSF